jgi:hypothetical protein
MLGSSANRWYRRESNKHQVWTIQGSCYVWAGEQAFDDARKTLQQLLYRRNAIESCQSRRDGSQHRRGRLVLLSVNSSSAITNPSFLSRLHHMVMYNNGITRKDAVCAIMPQSKWIAYSLEKITS